MMMTTTKNIFGKMHCSTCHKGNGLLICEGCLEPFCYTHVADHRQELNKQLEDVETSCNLIRQALNEQTTDSKNHPLIQQINRWEQESIERIRRAADDARQSIVKHTIGPMTEIEVKLTNISDEVRRGRKEDGYSEDELSRWENSLTKLKDKLQLQSTSITLREDSTPFIKKLYVDVSSNFPM